MKVTKAIEVLEDLLGEGPQYPPDDRREAVRLGIEALHRHRNRDYLTYNEMHQGLPGETLAEAVE